MHKTCMQKPTQHWWENERNPKQIERYLSWNERSNISGDSLLNDIQDLIKIPIRFLLL